MLLPTFLLLLLLTASTTAKKKKKDLSLQWAICDSSPTDVLRKLSYPPDLPIHKLQNITYYDLFPPEYTAHGLAFRTKLHKSVPISMVKVRFPNDKIEKPDGTECKWDRYGNGTWFTCRVANTLEEGKPLWSAEQIAFAERYFEVQWDQLIPYGPLVNPKWKIRILGHKTVFDSVDAEVDGETLHLMEVEIGVKKPKHGKKKKLYKKITKILVDAGVRICEEPQLPKTLRLFEALERKGQGGSDGLAATEQRPLM